MPLGAAKAAFLGAAGTSTGEEGFTLITTTTVSSPTQTVELTSIPQDYRDLKLVIRAAHNNVYGNITWVALTDAASMSSANYRIVEYGSTGVTSGNYEVAHWALSGNRMPSGDFAQGSSGRGTLNERQAAEFHIPNYTAVGATSGTGIYCFASGLNDIATPNYNIFFQFPGATYTGTSPITTISIYGEASGSDYLYQAGTQMSLYGIGTAP